MKIAIAIIVAVIVVAGAYLLFMRNQTPAQAPSLTAQNQTAAAQQAPVTNPSSALTVSYTDSGFTPATLTVHNGDTVQFVNNSSGQLWIASNPHPTHQGYSGTTVSQHCPDTTGTAFDQCAAVPTGGSYSFTFRKTGTWGYHNHANHSMTGTIVVTP